MISQDKSPEKIGKMFDEISGKYDKLNHILTMNIDKKWRREISDNILKFGLKKDRILDAASGTGDQTIELLKIDPEEIISCDISQGMLEIQKRKIPDSRVKILHLDFFDIDDEEGIDIVTMSFGFRNLNDQTGAVNKLYELLKPGGVAIILEMFKAKGMTAKLFNLYFGKVMPKVGNTISGSEYAYDYLFKSVSEYYTVEEFTEISKRGGFELLHITNNFLKIVNTIYIRKT